MWRLSTDQFTDGWVLGKQDSFICRLRQLSVYFRPVGLRVGVLKTDPVLNTVATSKILMPRASTKEDMKGCLDSSKSTSE
jgi:hypothetical protein